MPKPKYDHPVIQKGAVQVFAHLAQKPMSADLKKVKKSTMVVLITCLAASLCRPLLRRSNLWPVLFAVF